MDEKYWYDIYWKVVNSESESERMDFLKQIAHDQRKACAKTLENKLGKQYHELLPCEELYLEAVRNAEIEEGNDAYRRR